MEVHPRSSNSKPPKLRRRMCLGSFGQLAVLVWFQRVRRYLPITLQGRRDKPSDVSCDLSYSASRIANSLSPHARRYAVPRLPDQVIPVLRERSFVTPAFEAYVVLWDSLLRVRRRFALPCDAPLMR